MTEAMQRYLVDNNALFDLTSEHRTSARFRDIVRLPTEVIEEAGEYAQRERLDSLDYPTAKVLHHLKRVMMTIDPDDRSLVDLFQYKGTADPMLVASALAATEELDGLVTVHWTVVTGDDAVRRKCEEFEVDWCSASEFADILDGTDER